MNGHKYILNEFEGELIGRDYEVNRDERNLQQFYVKVIKIGFEAEEVYIYRDSNPFCNKFLGGTKMFRMSKKWSHDNG